MSIVIVLVVSFTLKNERKTETVDLINPKMVKLTHLAWRCHDDFVFPQTLDTLGE